MKMRYGKICSCAKYTKTYDFRTTKSDPIVKTYGSKSIGFYIHIGHGSGYGLQILARTTSSTAQDGSRWLKMASR